ncbi:hypothetical protein HMPREF0574_0886 [Mobiluncus curtisii subsp. curtisii ATCC 35241]|uniref:Uncharacterized protein n=1 Tax=Mobiluncus curtisii (strain ATCC 43063 / DSM 2711 / V125) TaxID=548479 RepID=D6ZKN1_MOBCV|nr:hypothetical protein HMPREF0573_10961 [Mobiluncus curtisii ATCC 43063]EFL93880.1 hypothetical protein HMPREF0574_0886 [Mobiluncus curtisii subsp. curtisii ATCC 35241]
MCSPVKCANCGKTTWTGCGQHIAAVQASVPPDQWCTCPEDKRKPQSLFASFFSH